MSCVTRDPIWVPVRIPSKNPLIWHLELAGSSVAASGCQHFPLSRMTCSVSKQFLDR
jgi:hypothetical protein